MRIFILPVPIFIPSPPLWEKSFLTTLKEIFEGNKDLFKDLYIYDKYDFVKYPVIRINWQGDLCSEQSILNLLQEILLDNESFDKEKRNISGFKYIALDIEEKRCVK